MTEAFASINAGFATADGHWTPERLAIWRSMTPQQRDFDRYQGWYPPGEGVCETKEGAQAIEQRLEDAWNEEHGCRCHINPPCWHCTDCPDCPRETS